jgi:predicted TIM-barrel fold metal-dependent hydrolase
MLQIRDRLLARHPKNTFIACHFSNQGNDLASLAKVLDRYPNLYVDLSARDYEMGRQPHTAAKFLARYKNRVLFGTDQTASKAMYVHWWRLLESADEYMPGPNWWRLYGLELPAPVLKAVYRDNARRLMNWTPVSGSS